MPGLAAAMRMLGQQAAHEVQRVDGDETLWYIAENRPQAHIVA